MSALSGRHRGFLSKRTFLHWKCSYEIVPTPLLMRMEDVGVGILMSRCDWRGRVPSMPCPASARITCPTLLFSANAMVSPAAGAQIQPTQYSLSSSTPSIVARLRTRSSREARTDRICSVSVTAALVHSPWVGSGIRMEGSGCRDPVYSTGGCSIGLTVQDLGFRVQGVAIGF